MVAEQFVTAYAALKQVAEAVEDGSWLRELGSVIPGMFDEHGDQRNNEERSIDVCHEEGLRVRIVGEDGLLQCQLVNLLAQLFIPETWKVFRSVTYAREEITGRPEEHSR